MVASMTAFARLSVQESWGQAVWEVRSVNHRYLEMGFKTPEVFRGWETDWRKLASRYLKRGKVECFLNFTASQQTAPILEINTSLVSQLLSHCEKLVGEQHVLPQVNAIDLLKWPEVVKMTQADNGALKEPVSALLEETLKDLVKNRQHEGAQLQVILQDKYQQACELMDNIKTKLPQSIKMQKEKLMGKLAAIEVKVDTERLEQELALLIQRADITEEVDRLNAHLQTLTQTLASAGPQGRRLDFLMQELHREANTLAAKSSEGDVIQIAIELKLLIEQMREQIQNVE